MSADAPVYNALLQSRVDVDDIVHRLQKHVPGQRSDGRVLQVSVWWYEPARSLSMRNLARAWSGLLAKHTGCTAGEMWAALCEQLLGTVEIIDPITRKPRITYRSSESLRTKKEYQEFVDGIERLAVEFFGIKLPAANDAAAWRAFRSIQRVATDGEKPR